MDIKFETFSDGLVGCLLGAMKDIHYLDEIGLPDYKTLEDMSQSSFICGGDIGVLKIKLPLEQQRDYEVFRTNLDALQKHYAKKKSVNHEQLSDAEFNLYRKIVFNWDMYAKDE